MRGLSAVCHPRSKAVMGELINGDRNSLWGGWALAPDWNTLFLQQRKQIGLSSSRTGVGSAVGGAYLVLGQG